jgi:protein-tyrosine-phosphatase
MFVCTANICRSPMAEGLARAEADRRGLPVELRSGGVLGLQDRAAAPNAIKACKEVGVDISAHGSSGVTAEDVAWVDAVLVMEIRHQQELHARFPQLEGRVVLLGTFGGRPEIDDPIGSWMWRFRRTRKDITRCIERFYELLDPAGVSD